jgi:phage gpG-like protein
MAFKAQIKGLDSLLKKVQTKSKDLQQDVEAEIHDFGDRVAQKASQRVVKDLNRLGQSTRAQHLPNGVLIGAYTDYAAFVEFGTGALVNVPAGLEDYAIQFKGKGIKQVNLPARPFLFNSFFEEKQSLLDNISKKLAK